MLLGDQMIDTLRALRALLSPTDAWTQRVFARNAKGVEVTILSPVASCWCLSGGLSKVCNDPNGKSDIYKQCHAALLAETGSRYWYLVPWNDLSSHEEVLALIDRTIEHA